MMMAVEPIFGGVLFGGAGLQLAPPFTSAWRVAWVVVASFVLEDFYFYWVHRFLHWGPIYRHVHKLHRERCFFHSFCVLFEFPKNKMITLLRLGLLPSMRIRLRQCFWGLGR